MDDLSLLVDLHRGGKRQGPGGEDETRLAIMLSGLSARKGLKIADIGCGTGASTLVLAKELDGSVTAVDFLPEFIHDLDIAAERENLGERIETLVASMEALPFEAQSFNAIWSEGAIYNMGFANGIKAWRRFLKPDGILAVSELTWLTQERPAELEQHWMQEYPEVDTASAKMAILEENGFSPVGYFALPKRCWLDNYYRPLQARFAAFVSRNGNSEAAAAIVAAEELEIALYERNSAFVFIRGQEELPEDRSFCSPSEGTLLATVLAALQTFFGFSERAEKHKYLLTVRNPGGPPTGLGPSHRVIFLHGPCAAPAQDEHGQDPLRHLCEL